MYEAIDLELLTRPIESGGSVVGEDMRLAADPSQFFLMKDLRAEARTAERQVASDADNELPVLEAGAAKWAQLSEIAQRVLQTQTKDLEVASWLCEALIRLDGFRGMAAGLSLMCQLMDLYWAYGLYPSEDEDGVETRAAPIGGLLGLTGVAALLNPIKLLPLSDHAPEIALWSLEGALAPLQGSDDAEARARASAKRTDRLEEIRKAVQQASPGFLIGVYGAISESLDSIDALVSAADGAAQTGRFGSQIIEPLRTIQSFYNDQVGHIVHGNKANAAPQSEEEQAFLEGEGAADEGKAAAVPGRIANREDAYAVLLRIADYFEKAEPQAITARSLREVVRRGRLPLDELLFELLPEDQQRTLYLLRAGVKPG